MSSGITLVPLANRLGPDTIAQFERAAKERFFEAEILLIRRSNAGSIYLNGYVVEMLIKAAYFREYGLTPHDPIQPSDRARAHADAKSRGITISGPHDFAGWARYLVDFVGGQPRPRYDLP